MEAFLQSYGLWIVLGGIFLAMHWFGMGCGGRHGGRDREGGTPATPGKDGTPPARSDRPRGCH